MKRARLTGEAAVYRTVNDLVNKFEYPEPEFQAPPPLLAGGGGAPTVVVAAADSTDFSKSRADFQATGANDQTTIQAAVNALTVALSSSAFSNGRILICEGTYNCTWPSDGTGAVRVTGSGAVTFEGMGTQNTFIVVDGEAPVSGQDFFIMSYGHVRNMAIFNNNFTPTNPTNAINFSGGDNCSAERVWVSNFSGNGIELDVNESHVQDCRIEDCGTGVRIQSQTWIFVSGCYISDSATAGIGGTADFSQIRHNVLEDAGIILAGTDESEIVANIVRDPDGYGIDLGGNRTVIANNNVLRAGTGTDNTFDAIRVSGNENMAQGNRVTPASSGGNQTRYGLNIASGSNNAAFANYLGDASEYGTDDYVDAGTATITTPNGDGQFAY